MVRLLMRRRGCFKIACSAKYAVEATIRETVTPLHIPLYKPETNPMEQIRLPGNGDASFPVDSAAPLWYHRNRARRNIVTV